jgi:hypothetical protein
MDIMIDIETLGTRSDAAILQIGLVQFDRETGEFGKQLLVSVDRDFYDDNPQFHVDEQTVKWWEKQGAEAQRSLEINKVATLAIALDMVTEFFVETAGFTKSFSFGEDAVWGLGQFDIPILNYAFGVTYGAGDAMPWGFRQERDLRTVLAEAHRDGKSCTLPPECADLIKHRADHDAIKQVYHLLELDK